MPIYFTSPFKPLFPYPARERGMLESSLDLAKWFTMAAATDDEDQEAVVEDILADRELIGPSFPTRMYGSPCSLVSGLCGHREGLGGSRSE